jgi:hypothetical protein
VPDAPALDLVSRMRAASLDDQDMQTIQEDHVLSANAPNPRNSFDKNALVQIKTVSSEGSVDANGLYGATTVNSLIERHDMYQGIGRIATEDIRGMAHET